MDSALGDKRANLAQALKELARIPGVLSVTASPVYETSPREYEDQPWFANQVARLELDPGVSPQALLDALLAIETGMGRTRTLAQGRTRIMDQGRTRPETQGRTRTMDQGRTRPEAAEGEAHARFGPRVIDLDLLLYHDVEHDEPGLTVPHPRMRERAFVLVPLADLAPDLTFPDGESLENALGRLDFTLQDGRIIQ